MFEEQIKSLFLRLVATQSDTNTQRENYIAEHILNWIKELPYFSKHPELCGAYPLIDDPFSRNVVWSLVKGSSNKTVILMHHYDAIDIEEYGKLKSVALRPDELAMALKLKSIPEQAMTDLTSGEWTFGRGVADMKAGAAIQLVLSAYFSELEDFEGNILLLSVPDEETLSRGMLSAVNLMTELKEKYSLDYVITINSEPYFNQTKGKAIYYEGSVGKIMPVLFVKVIKSHIGDPFNGFSPSLVLSDLQKKTELNIDLCDVIGHEATPPPVWVNLKDRKKAYDASIPEAATGYFNWLTFTRSPKTIIDKLVSLANRSLRDTMIHFADAYENYCALIGETPEKISFIPKVLTFDQLYQIALAKKGTAFSDDYLAYQETLKQLLNSNAITLPEATTRLVDHVQDFIDLEGPAIIVAISGPYYPHVNNSYSKNKLSFSLNDFINTFAKEEYNLSYETQGYFMGISDLSYATWSGNEADVAMIKSNSPGWDVIYKIPFKALTRLDMPVINLGPWGKDLHKITERVYTKDVYERVPHILKALILKCLEA